MRQVKKKLFMVSIILLIVLFLAGNIVVFLPKRETPPEPGEGQQAKQPLQESPRQQPSPPQQHTLLYVVNQLSNDITVINPATREKITTIPVGKFPSDAFLSENHLYVTNTNDNTITVIDTTNHITKTIPTPQRPRGNVGRGQDLYVISEDEDKVARIHQESGRQTDIAFIKKPTAVAISNAKDKIYVLSPFSREVSIINPAIDRVVKKISIGEKAKSMAFDGEETILLVSNGRDISFIPLKRGKETSRIKTRDAPFQMAFTPTNEFVFITHPEANTITLLSMLQEKEIATIPAEGSPTAIAIQGTTAYITNYHSHTLSFLDTQTLKITGTIPVGLGPVAISIQENA